MPWISAPLEDRFMSHVIMIPEHGCWEWDGYQDRDGYCQTTIGRKTFIAHRVSYELFIGPIPEGLEIDHVCRNRGCVNPRHLEPVTSGENSRRAVSRKGRKKRQNYPWNSWLQSLETEQSVSISCETEKAARWLRAYLARNPMRREQVVIVASGSQVVLTKNVSRETKALIKCGRCDKPKHVGGCRGVTKARHSRSWKDSR
jgi:hypothetical protein